MHVKRERAVTWWNSEAQTRPVLDSSSFVPIPMLPRNVCIQKATRRMERSVNTHNRLRYFLTNKIFLLQVMYRYVRMIFIVKCVKIACFSISYAALWWQSMIFIVLSSLKTVHDTVNYRYCIFSLLYRLLRIRLKHQNPLLTYLREREKLHCKCTM